MSEQERRRGGGAKLNRSETVTVRLDPITRYAAELAASKDRVTLSSFIEKATREAARLRTVAFDKEGGRISALQVAEETWSPDETSRLFMLAMNAPHLLPTDQQALADALAFFMHEIDLLLKAGGLLGKLQVDIESGGTLFVPGHLAKSAFQTIRQAVSGQQVDYPKIAAAAKKELVDRGILAAS